MGDSDEPLSPAAARRLAEEFGADLMVLAEIIERDGDVRVSARLYDLGSEDPPTLVVIPGQKAEQLASLVDQLSELLLSQHLEQQGMRLASTAALTTESFPALKAYLTGESDYRSSHWTRAMQHFRDAVLLDSTFALAHYRRASAAEWAAEFGVVDSAASAAYRHRDRLSTHDRELVEAFYAWTQGDPATAGRLYRRVTERQPENAEAWYRLGEVEYHYNPLRGRSFTASKAAFQRALRITPGQQPILFHLMEIALRERDYVVFNTLLAEAGLEGEAMHRRTAVRMIATGDTAAITASLADLQNAYDGTVFAVATGLAHYAGDLAGAERVAEIMTQPTRGPSVRGTGHLLLAQLAAGRGRWTDARRQLAQLEAIHPPSARVHRALYAAVPFLEVPRAELEAIRGELAAWEPGPADDIDALPVFLGIHNGAYPLLRSYGLGLMEARLGNEAAASREVESLEAVTDDSTGLARSLAAGIRLLLAVQGGQQGRDGTADLPLTTASLGQVANSAFYARALERYNRGAALLATDSATSAAEWFGASMEGRNEIFLAGPATFMAAQAHQAAERPELARAGYARFLELWEDADPPLRHRLEAAERELARLGATGG